MLETFSDSSWEFQGKKTDKICKQDSGIYFALRYFYNENEEQNQNISFRKPEYKTSELKKNLYL